VNRWKALVYRHKWGVVAANVYQDLLRRNGITSGQIGNPYTQPRNSGDVVHAVDAVNHTFENYSRYTGLTRQRLRGARVLELGPGHNVGVALRFLSEGAARVVCLDKFVPMQDTPIHRMVYRTLRDQLDSDGRGRFDEAIQIEPCVRLREPWLRYIHNTSLESATDLIPPHTFDLIVSNAVLEEAYDADRAFDAMDRLLAPGGQMMHVIDLRDYGMFTKHGFHPLEFLTVPEWVYRHMAECVGQPNRRLVNYYRSEMTRLGYSATIHITWIVGSPHRLPHAKVALTRGTDYPDGTAALIESIRPRLINRYREMAQEDLAVASIVLVATKPSSPNH
jgi:SAM-dependent methyltransferase